MRCVELMKGMWCINCSTDRLQRRQQQKMWSFTSSSTAWKLHPRCSSKMWSCRLSIQQNGETDMCDRGYVHSHEMIHFYCDCMESSISGWKKERQLKYLNRLPVETLCFIHGDRTSKDVVGGARLLGHHEGQQFEEVFHRWSSSARTHVQSESSKQNSYMCLQLPADLLSLVLHHKLSTLCTSWNHKSRYKSVQSF